MKTRNMLVLLILFTCLSQYSFSMNLLCNNCCKDFKEGATELAGEAWLYIKTQAGHLKEKFQPILAQKLNQVIKELGDKTQDKLLNEIDEMLDSIGTSIETKAYTPSLNIGAMLTFQQKYDLQDYSSETVAVHLKYLLTETSTQKTNRSGNYNEATILIAINTDLVSINDGIREVPHHTYLGKKN